MTEHTSDRVAVADVATPRWDTSGFERAFPRLPVMRRVETFESVEVHAVVAVDEDGHMISRERYREYTLDPSEFTFELAADWNEPEIVAWGLYGRVEETKLVHIIDCESQGEAETARSLIRDLRAATTQN